MNVKWFLRSALYMMFIVDIEYNISLYVPFYILLNIIYCLYCGVCIILCMVLYNSNKRNRKCNQTGNIQDRNNELFTWKLLKYNKQH